MALRIAAAAALSLALLAPIAAPAAPAPAVIPREDLQSDLVVLRSALETVHPGLWRYHTRASFERAFGELRRSLDRPVRRDTAFLAIQRFVATIRCGHTHAGPYNQGRLVTAELVRRGGRVPFHFRWLGRRMVVTRDLAGGRLPRGTEVLRVNGVPARDLLARMLPLVSADGSNDAKRVSELEVQGRSGFELFDLVLPLLVPGVEDTLRLAVRDPGARGVRTLTLAPLTWEDRQRDHDAAQAAAGPLPWTLDLSDPAMAVLRMPTWAVYGSGVDWDSTLDAMMDRVVASGATALVVDLRDNGGGVDAGDVILRRMLPRDTVLRGFQRFVRYRRIPAALDSVLDTWDDGFRDHTADTPSTPGPDGLYPLTRAGESAGGDTLRARGPRFTGRLFVLVSAVNSSATFQFAEAVRALRLGTRIGMPSGGNQRGINGGEFFFLRLPRSRIEVDLPVIGYFPDGPRPDAGLEPDVRVETTLADIANGRDPEREVVRRLLGER